MPSLFSARVAGIAVLAAVASFGHVLYPVWLAARTRGRPEPEPPQPSEWPGLTTVVPAYRESAVIAAKVEDLRQNGYPGPLQVLVAADDEDTAEAARKTGVEVVSSPQRLGKSQAVTRAFEAAAHPLVVMTDANARLEPGSLAALVRWFEDPTVGAVAGEKRVDGAGEAVYWRFESWLKRRESRLGTTIGLVGELAALRSSAHGPVPGDIINDDLWLALDVTERGRRIMYEPTAVAWEEGTANLREEWERRTRNLAGSFEVFWRRRAMLVPGRSPVAMQILGHRVVRSSLGPLAHAALVAAALPALGRSRLAVLFCAGHAVGIAGLVRQQQGSRVTRVEQLLAQVLFLQGVALGGTVRWLRGDRSALWRKAERVPASAQSVEA